ncbi:ATP-binding protein [Actinocatenispora sera]|uniref:AAA domain-containing protein n=1 Tax=Actinocatenispora sera TaxID=390989 RepID=A0A810L868_9ACTN|nr:AAA family ATPase [Actinocatenispora sera]BCJ30526.1 hypothetical protein Asera_46340 [Actinocatenispora sera]
MLPAHPGEPGLTQTRPPLEPAPDPDPDALPRARPRLVRLADVTPERITWLWPGYLAAGKLHVIDGDPGTGKSTMTTDLAARITTGKPWPDGQPGTGPAGVVLLSAEDDPADTIRPRLDAAGADAARVVALTSVTEWDARDAAWVDRLVTLPDDAGMVADAIAAVGAALVVVDPLMAYLGEKVNEYQDKDVRRALTPLIKTAEKTGCAIVLVRHFTKGGGPSPIYRGGGSIGIIGAARLGYAVAKDPRDEGRVIVAPTKANIAVMPPALAYRLVDAPDHGCARIEWDGTVDYTAADLLRDPAADQDRAASRNRAAAWLVEFLTERGGQAPSSEVKAAAEQAGMPWRTVGRARESEGVIADRSGFAGGTVWRLPDAPASVPATPPGGTNGTNGISAGHAIGATGTNGGTDGGANGAVDVPLPVDVPGIGSCERCGRPARVRPGRQTVCESCAPTGTGRPPS